MRELGFLLICFTGFHLIAQPAKPLVPEIEIVALNDEMRQFLKVYLKNYNSKENILQRLIHLMFAEEGLNIKYQPGKTKTAVEVFETRMGNCLGFTNLFIAMAREAGLHASYQQIYTVPHWGRQKEVVIQNRHVNAHIWINNLPYTVDFYPERDKREFHRRVISDQEAMAQFYNNLGVEAFADQDMAYAQANFIKALALDDSISFIWTNYGALLRHLDQFDAAEDSYKHAIRINRHDYTAMSNLAKLYRAQDQVRKAEKWEERSARYMKRSPYYHFFLGEEAYLAGQYETALDHYKRAAHLNDLDHAIHFALARGYFRLGDKERAAESLRRAQELAAQIEDAIRYEQKLQSLLASN